MSAERVLAAAAALREFSTAELASYCDEEPDAVARILDSTGGAVERTSHDPVAPVRWRVAEPIVLRRLLRSRTDRTRLPRRPTVPDDDNSVDQLWHAERTLLRCSAERSGERRRVLVSTAVNHLRQAVASILHTERPWWAIELGSERVDDELRHLPDPATGTRLRLGVTVARLAVDHVTGTPVSAGGLVETVAELRSETADISGDDWLEGLVRGLVDLTTAQVARVTGPAVHQLVVAVARRRVAAQAETDPGGALCALDPLMRRLAGATGAPQVDDLYRSLHHLPDGDHAIVYTDLLALLPRDVGYDRRGEPLPGGLVELVGDHAAAGFLRHCAATLESDLRSGDIHSDAGLIGQAAQVLQQLADETRDDEASRSRGDATRTELNVLAKTPMWPAPAEPTEGRPR